MTFYEIAEQMFIKFSCRKGITHQRTYDKNKEEFKKAKECRSIYSIIDFEPWIFHPGEAKKVVVSYTEESRKKPEEVTLKWTQTNGELDEKNHTYPDGIENVCFIKDVERFCV